MWYYKGKEFTPDMIPEGAVGFVYEMSAVIDGKIKQYIGKKNFYSNTKTKLKQSEISGDRRKKNYKIVSKLAYEKYFSSNDILKNWSKYKPDSIKREILYIAFSASELTYLEVRTQFEKRVLETDQYLNGNILGKFYKKVQ